MSKFKATRDNPYHLSVGAILTDNQGRFILMRLPDGRLSMMTETVEDGESLEDALHRGLQEELQAQGAIVSFAGATQCTVTDHRGPWQKTIVWLKVSAIHIPHWTCSDCEFVQDLEAVENVDETRWPNTTDEPRPGVGSI
jgi:hypothetical protein